MCILCMAITSNDVLFVVVTYKFLPRTTSGGKMLRKRNRRKRTVRRTILVRRVTARWRKRAKKMEVRKSWSAFVLDLGVLWISQIIVWFPKNNVFLFLAEVLDMETSCSSTDSNSKCCNNSSTDPPESDGIVTNNKPQKTPQPKHLVKFTMVNSYGSAEMDYKIKEDGSPLKLTSKKISDIHMYYNNMF